MYSLTRARLMSVSRRRANNVTLGDHTDQITGVENEHAADVVRGHGFCHLGKGRILRRAQNFGRKEALDAH